MNKVLVIGGTSIAFAMIGVLVSYLCVKYISQSQSIRVAFDDIVVLSVLPPLVGTILGIGIGIVAARFAPSADSK